MFFIRIITHFLTVVNRLHAKILVNIHKTCCYMNLLYELIAFILQKPVDFWEHFDYNLGKIDYCEVLYPERRFFRLQKSAFR